MTYIKRMETEMHVVSTWFCYKKNVEHNSEKYKHKGCTSCCMLQMAVCVGCSSKY